MTRRASGFPPRSVRSRLFCCLSLVLISAAVVRGQTPSPSATPAARIDRVEIVEKGLYRIEFKEKIEDPTTLGGYRYVHAKGELIKDTATIPAVNGTQFGFRYVVSGEPKGAKVSTRIVAHYPEGGRTNPATGKTATKDEFPQTPTIGAPILFFFNMIWGNVPGVWTIEVWSQDRKLAEQKFTLVQP